MNKTICFDFDGVIHSYKSGWQGAENIPDPPVDGIGEVLRELYYSDQYRIIIHSSRAETSEGKWAIWNWLIKYDLDIYVSKVLNTKPPAMVYVDDRAICFDGNTKNLVERINGFRSWLEKDES